METKKMNLANIQGKLSRTEMKNIMAGSSTCTYGCTDPSKGIMCGSYLCFPVGYNCLSCGNSYICC